MYRTIGIDLGHCETTSSYPCQPIPGNDRYEVMRLSEQGKDQVITTQLILTDDQMRRLTHKDSWSFELLQSLGRIRIGNDLPGCVPDGERFCYFKVPPKDFGKPCCSSEAARQSGLTHGAVMACFAHVLVNNLISCNDTELSATDRKWIDLLVGCPATDDWTGKEAMDAYARLIHKATGVRHRPPRGGP